MAEAIVKLSWRVSSAGKVKLGQNASVGGICGSCFTLSSGITITCAHTAKGLFKPNEGFDKCAVFVCENNGKITRIQENKLDIYEDYDACVIAGFSASNSYEVSDSIPTDVSQCNLYGFYANAAPFQVVVDHRDQSLMVVNFEAMPASQNFYKIAGLAKNITINSQDIKIENKTSYIFDLAATVGLSGGPVVNSTDKKCVGMSFMGLPADSYEKLQIAAIDIRPLISFIK